MPIYRRAFKAALALAVVAALWVGYGARAAAAVPSGSGAILNLSGWNFQTQGLVRLDGPWALYRNRLLAPGEFPPPGPPHVPSVRLPGCRGGVRGPGGYATYRLRVRLPDPGRPLALFLPDPRSAYRLWVDGDLLATGGVVGTDSRSEVAWLAPALVYFTPRGRILDLVLQVSNFHFRCAGLAAAPVLGPATQVDAWRLRTVTADTILFGAILIVALYHLLLFAQRRDDRSTLYFGLFCLVIALRSSLLGQGFLLQITGGMPIRAELTLEYGADYLALPLFMLFLRSLFPEEASARSVRVAEVAAGLGLLSLAGPTAVASWVILPYEGIVCLFVAYSLYALVAAVRRRREGSVAFLVGSAVFFATLVSDLLDDNLLAPTGHLVPLGMFVLILAQSAVLARRFSGAFTDLRRSRRMLTEREEGLRKQIAEVLHSRVQTRLLMVGRRLQESEGLRGADPERAHALMQQALRELELVREEDVRRASHLLHPSVIQVGLVPAARSLADGFGHGLSIDLRVGPRLGEVDAAIPCGIPESVRLAAYRVLEEALGNVAGHAGAGRAVISLDLTPEREVRVEVRDDGQGLDPRRLRPGLGLRSVAARVGEMGGRWRVDGRPGGGTTLLAWLPLRSG